MLHGTVTSVFLPFTNTPPNSPSTHTRTHQHPPAPTSTHIDTQLTQLTLCSNVMARRDPGDHAFRLIEGYLHREVLAPVCKLESTELGWTRQVVEQRKDR